MSKTKATNRQGLPSKKSKTKSNVGDQPRSGPAGVVIRREWPITVLFKDGGNGIYEWNPGSVRAQMGSLSHYKPLAARTMVRFSFVTNTDLHFSPRVGAPSKATTKWSSGWVAISDVLPMQFDAYGTAPAGVWRVECAGVVTASVDFHTSPDGMPLPKPVEVIHDDESDNED